MKTKNNSVAIITPAILEKSMAQIMANITVDVNNNASFKAGAKVTPAELAYAANETLIGAEGATIRAVNILRLARNLAPVKEGEGDDAKERPAFEVAKEQFRALARTDGAFYNMLQLVDSVDVIETNKLTVSPFAVKEAMGALRKLGALPKAGSTEPLKLTNGTNGKARPIVDLFKSGDAKVNAIRETLAKAGATKKKGAKKESPADKKKREAEEAKAEKAKYAPEVIDRDVVSLVGIVEKAFEVSGRDKVRAAIQANVFILARMAGLQVVEPGKTNAELPKSTPAPGK